MLRQAALSLSRVAPVAAGEALPPAGAVTWQSLCCVSATCLPRHEFAAWTQQAAAAAAVRPTATPAADPACPAEPTPEAPPDVYVRLDERVQQQYSVPARSVFAVVEVGGTQYKVAPNDVIVVEKLADVDVNDKLQLQRVLLLGSQAETIVGRPYVPHAAVTAAVEEQFLDGKVLIFHKRRRKNSRRLRGHRQPLTTLRILDVSGIADSAAAGIAAL